MNSRERRIKECLRLQGQVSQELSGLHQESESNLRRQVAIIGELACELELELDFPDERLVVLDIKTLSRLVNIAWFGEVLVDVHRDGFVPLVGITCTDSLNESWGHFIIQQKSIRENMKWLQTGAYLVPAGTFAAAVFPVWKTKVLRRTLIPECPLLPIMSYDEYIGKLGQRTSHASWRTPSLSYR